MCWQRFDINFNAFFMNNFSKTEEPAALVQQRYSKLFLENMLPKKTDELFSLKLNDSQDLSRIYLYVNTISDLCSNYNNLNSSLSKEECIERQSSENFKNIVQDQIDNQLNLNSLSTSGYSRDFNIEI